MSKANELLKKWVKNSELGFENIEDLENLHDETEKHLNLNDDFFKKLKRAVDRAVPKRPETIESSYAQGPTVLIAHVCKCGCQLRSHFKYCSNCGQAIDWSVEE